MPTPVPDLLRDGPQDADLTLVLAHGAGAAMDTPFMDHFAQALAETGFGVVRFEFPYMAAKRSGGGKRPPDREPKLLECWQAVIAALRAENGPDKLAIGGKSMGGRMASLIVDDVKTDGLVCLGYPFHPPGKPERLRTAHLETLQTPTLIVQGDRDPFGTREEVAAYSLSPAVRLHWCEDGNHDLVPRKASGLTGADNWTRAVGAIAAFLKGL